MVTSSSSPLRPGVESRSSTSDIAPELPLGSGRCLALASRTGQSALVEVTFAQRPDGIIEASLGEKMPTFSHALNDAVSSRAPRGAVHTGLSTYWIDRVERDARAALADESSAPFASGNITILYVIEDRVHASFEFDDDGGQAESMTIRDFFDLLAAWRQRVIDGGGVHGAEAALLLTSDQARPMGPPSA